ncbi:MAG: hypothetical protein E7175_05020 [Erysipelotrichaceae bacterium]|nr:hypothetical protein [Erysipelotrichaceae bacterium]
MVKYENKMIEIIDALNKSSLLQNCIISGSWAMFFYKEVFEGFIPPIATTDFDIFLPNVSKIKENSLNKLLIDLDYLRDDDSFTGKTKYFSKDGFEIEFLTLPDRTMEHVIKVPAIGIGAETLPKMNIATWNYITINYHNYLVNVPSPASYCLQKLLINKDREEEKRIKDIDAIKYILNYIEASNKYKTEFIQSFESAPKKWKRSIKETLLKYELDEIIKLP